MLAFLSKLSLSAEIQSKDLATQGDQVVIDVNQPANEQMKELTRLATASNANVVMTGSLNTTANDIEQPEDIEIKIRLFEAETKRIALETTLAFVDLKTVRNMPEVNMEGFNQLIDDILKQTLPTIHPEKAQAILAHLVGKPVSQSYQALNYLVQAQKKQDSSEKITFYEAAIQADPELEIAYYNLARAHRLEGNYEESIRFYRQALEVSHSSNELKSVYATDAGIGCAILGKTELAMQWWLKAIDYDKTNIHPYFNIANTCEDLNEFEKATQFFEQAQALAPDDFRTFFNLARIYSKTGAWDKALGQYQKQLTTESDDPWCHSDIATCYLNLKQPEQARGHLNKVLELDPTGEAAEYANLILMGLDAG